MSPRTFIWISLTVGSTIGAYIPDLWGSSVFSFSSIIWSGIGGLAGVWLGFKISHSYF